MSTRSRREMGRQWQSRNYTLYASVGREGGDEALRFFTEPKSVTWPA